MNLLEDRTLLTVPGRKLYTAEDLERLPSDARYELIRGELCLMSNNSAEHENITVHLAIQVGNFIEQAKLGECFAAETCFTIEDTLIEENLLPGFSLPMRRLFCPL